jgi:hypothetical protein
MLLLVVRLLLVRLLLVPLRRCCCHRWLQCCP